MSLSVNYTQGSISKRADGVDDLTVLIDAKQSERLVDKLGSRGRPNLVILDPHDVIGSHAQKERGIHQWGSKCDRWAETTVETDRRPPLQPSVPCNQGIPNMSDNLAKLPELSRSLALTS